MGVFKDSVKSHQKFKEKHHLPFTLLSDPETVVLNKYGYGKKKSSTEENSWGSKEQPF
jgi:thioredoxin-dependent peroxiredoxin